MTAKINFQFWTLLTAKELIFSFGLHWQQKMNFYFWTLLKTKKVWTLLTANNEFLVLDLNDSENKFSVLYIIDNKKNWFLVLDLIDSKNGFLVLDLIDNKKWIFNFGPYWQQKFDFSFWTSLTVKIDF
jgi:hypothetical protein